MATESTEEHGKIRSKNLLATEAHGSTRKYTEEKMKTGY